MATTQSCGTTRLRRFRVLLVSFNYVGVLPTCSRARARFFRPMACTRGCGKRRRSRGTPAIDVRRFNRRRHKWTRQPKASLSVGISRGPILPAKRGVTSRQSRESRGCGLSATNPIVSHSRALWPAHETFTWARWAAFETRSHTTLPSLPNGAASMRRCSVSWPDGSMMRKLQRLSSPRPHRVAPRGPVAVVGRWCRPTCPFRNHWWHRPNIRHERGIGHTRQPIAGQHHVPTNHRRRPPMEAHRDHGTPLVLAMPAGGTSVGGRMFRFGQGQRAVPARQQPSSGQVWAPGCCKRNDMRRSGVVTARWGSRCLACRRW